MMENRKKQCIYALIHTHQSNHPSDFAAMSVARDLALQESVSTHAVIVGTNTGPAIEHARLNGFDAISVLTLDADIPALQTHQLTDVFTHAISEIGMNLDEENTIFLVSTGSECEPMAGQLAARLDASPMGKAIGLSFDQTGHLVVERAAFSGRLLLSISPRHNPCVIAVRSQSHQDKKEGAVSSTIPVKKLSNAITLRDAFDMEAMPRGEQHASLEGAKLVIAGGRGLGNQETFDSLYTVANKLGGAVGSSLPAVDAGWAPVTRQVGQSGKYVSPDIYVAIGISGTPQHMAGIDPQTKIVAINSDPEAHIFKIAHTGVVAEWQALLPPLMTALDRQQQD